MSSNAVGARVEQHRNVIEAAKRAGVGLLAYTSVLRADTSTLSLAGEHVTTEALLRDSGVPHVLLRNGWYTENYTGSIGPELAHGAVIGSSGDGRISAATRADYAAAAAAVLASAEPQAGRIYELAGDQAFSMADYAAELAQQAGKPVAYHDMPEADYAAALVQAGLPAGFAQVLAQCSASAGGGSLFDDSHTLSKLIGRPTTRCAPPLPLRWRRSRRAGSRRRSQAGPANGEWARRRSVAANAAGANAPVTRPEGRQAGGAQLPA